MLYVYPPKPLDLRSLGVGGRYLSSAVPQDGTQEDALCWYVKGDGDHEKHIDI
jgi:hypothetical protein